MNSLRKIPPNIQMATVFSFINIAVVMVIAGFVRVPGYMDAEYYYAGGKQFIQGNGFTEPYVWNYLDGIETLPRPSHTYWMPLVSIFAAGGMWLGGNEGFESARLIFLLLFTLTPATVYLIALGLKFDPKIATLAGFLAMFSGFYLPYFATTDGFVLYVLLGGSYFLILQKQFNGSKENHILWFLLGLVCGLMHLTRADGLIWFIGSCLILFITAGRAFVQTRSYKGMNIWIANFALLTIGYLIPMALWYTRNLSLYSSAMSPAGAKVLWLTMYDQLFTYPSSNLTYQAWIASGWDQIIIDRVKAFRDNLMTFTAVQNNIYLLPLTIIGLSKLRKRREFQVALIYWIITLVVMTIFYPYAGSRGGLFHSGAAFQIMLWMSAAVGLKVFVNFMAQKRNWEPMYALKFFSIAVIAAGLIFTIFISYTLIYDGSANKNIWNEGWKQHEEISNRVREIGIPDDGVIMINNPPGFQLVSNRPAVVIPYGDIQTAIEVANVFNAAVLVLQPDHVAGMDDLYDHPRNLPGIQYLGSFEGIRIFRFIRLTDD